jgi:general secretion pathway protein E
MILVTGPTGSGKTVSLYTGLHILNREDTNISTAEDPSEINLPGVNQVNVNPKVGLTFAAAMRAFLRQDPDVIMVGEMRDAETAHIGVHAALTGHLVLTTLHTNTAAGAIPRMIDMGLESFLLASSVRAIIGQRLVRVLCEHCRVRHELTAKEITADYRYETLGFKAGETVYQPKGCDYCGGIGFRGRKGVFEVMEIGPEVRRAIGPKTDAADLEAVARREGMTTMTEDGVAKCRAGMTTLDEVFRVTMSL